MSDKLGLRPEDIIDDPILDSLKKESELVSQIVTKEREIKKHRVDKEYSKILENSNQQKKIKELSLSKMDDSYFDRLDQEESMMYQSSSKKIVCVTESLTKMVNMSYPNLILFGAKTGSGKTTLVSNVVHKLLADKRRVLVISNEQSSLALMNSVVCLHKRWNESKIKEFSPEQKETLRKLRRVIGTSGRLVCVDSQYELIPKAVNSYEGITALLDRAYELYKSGEEPFDAIVIDYFQNISQSSSGKDRLYDVLRKVSDYLNDYFQKYPAPIIVMSQIKPEAEEDTPFELKIKDCKDILLRSTQAIEMIPNYKSRKTVFLCHKNRTNSSIIGTKVSCGWDKGRFVEYTDEFVREVAREIGERSLAEVRSAIGLPEKGSSDGKDGV